MLSVISLFCFYGLRWHKMSFSEVNKILSQYSADNNKCWSASIRYILSEWIAFVLNKDIKNLDFVRAESRLYFRPEHKFHSKSELELFVSIRAVTCDGNEYVITDIRKLFDEMFERDECLNCLKKYTEISLIFPLAFAVVQNYSYEL